MKFLFGDHHTIHPEGQFCARIVTEHYFLSYFETPFAYERDGVMLRGEAGDMLIQPPGSVIHHGCEEAGYVNTWAYISEEVLGPLLDDYPLPLNTAFPAGLGVELERYVQQATQEFTVRAAGYEELLRCLTAHLVISLYRRHHQPRDAVERLERLHEELRRYPEKPWKLKTMAEQCGYSVSRFSTLYKERFGVSPKHDVLLSRLTLAKKMLRYTDRSIGDVAEACGFENTPYFSKHFKSFTGVSPREYRRAAD